MADQDMRVCMYYSNQDVRVQKMACPRPGPGEMLVKVMASGICGSDVMEWYRRDKVPLVLGHEVAGEVVELGEGTEKFQKGDRVAVTHHVPCNTCRHCLDGHHTMCDTLLKGTYFDPGGFAEYIRVPAINVDRGAFLIPEGVSYEAASFMEPLACVLRGQRMARIQPGQTVLVMGSGITGLLHILLARSLGAGLVIAADTIPFRLEMAQKVGAHFAFEASEGLEDSIREVNQGYLADQVVLCFEGFIEAGIAAVERGGTVLFFGGASEGAKLQAGINDMFWRSEVTFTSSYAGAPRDCDQALRLIRSGSVQVEGLITHSLPLGRVQEGFEAVCKPFEHDSIKVVLKPWD